MEKLLLSTFLSYDELDIINHEHIYSPVFVTELCHGRRITVTDRFDNLVGKFFRSNVKHLGIRILVNDEMTY